jgi:hypothetical protein
MGGGRREWAVGDPAGGKDARGRFGDKRDAEPGCHGGVGALQCRRLQGDAWGHPRGTEHLIRQVVVVRRMAEETFDVVLPDGTV